MMSPQPYVLCDPPPTPRVNLFGLVDISYYDFFFTLGLGALLSLCLLALVVLHYTKTPRCNTGYSLLPGPPTSLSAHAQIAVSPISSKELAPADSSNSSSTVVLDADTFRRLVDDRLQLHVKVKSLEASNTTLRSRVLFLETSAKEGASHSLDDLEEALAAERKTAADTLAAERASSADALAALITDRDAMSKENAELRADRNVLRAQKAALAADLEALHTEMSADTEAFSGDRTVLDLEERLARETVKAVRATAEVSRLQEELATTKAQLAVHEQDLEALMHETVRLMIANELRGDFQEFVQNNATLWQAQLQEAEASSSEISEELRMAKASLAVLQEKYDAVDAEADAIDAKLTDAYAERNWLRAKLQDALAEVNRLEVCLADLATPTAA